MLATTRRVAIEWGDCDPAGIVWYPRYFGFFDAATAALFRAATGLAKGDMLARYGIAGIPMVDTRSRFLVPCRFGDEVEIETQVVALRRSSFDIRHALSRDGALAVECVETRVWTARHPDDPDRLRAVPLPADVIAALNGAG